MTWYSLSSITGDHTQLCVRFVPAGFTNTTEAPVLEVLIVAPSDHAAATQVLSRFREDFVIQFSSTASSFSVVGEMDDEETTVHGQSVVSTYKSYSVEELLEVGEWLTSAHQKETTYALAQSRKIQDIDHFVSDLLNRAESKRTLSTRAAGAIDAQIDVLTRVPNRLRGA